MPRCGATFDESSVPPCKGGTSGGFVSGLSTPSQTRQDRCRFRLLSPFGKGDFQGVFHAAPRLMKRASPLDNGAVKKFGWACEPDSVGTRCSASVLGYRRGRAAARPYP